MASWSSLTKPMWHCGGMVTDAKNTSLNIHHYAHPHNLQITMYIFIT